MAPNYDYNKYSNNSFIVQQGTQVKSSDSNKTTGFNCIYSVEDSSKKSIYYQEIVKIINKHKLTITDINNITRLNIEKLEQLDESTYQKILFALNNSAITKYIERKSQINSNSLQMKKARYLKQLGISENSIDKKYEGCFVKAAEQALNEAKQKNITDKAKIKKLALDYYTALRYDWESVDDFKKFNQNPVSLKEKLTTSGIINNNEKVTSKSIKTYLIELKAYINEKVQKKLKESPKAKEAEIKKWGDMLYRQSVGTLLVNATDSEKSLIDYSLDSVGHHLDNEWLKDRVVNNAKFRKFASNVLDKVANNKFIKEQVKSIKEETFIGFQVKSENKEQTHKTFDVVQSRTSESGEICDKQLTSKTMNEIKNAKSETEARKATSDFMKNSSDNDKISMFKQLTIEDQKRAIANDLKTLSYGERLSKLNERCKKWADVLNSEVVKTIQSFSTEDDIQEFINNYSNENNNLSAAGAQASVTVAAAPEEEVSQELAQAVLEHEQNKAKISEKIDEINGNQENTSYREYEQLKVECLNEMNLSEEERTHAIKFLDEISNGNFSLIMNDPNAELNPIVKKSETKNDEVGMKQQEKVDVKASAQAVKDIKQAITEQTQVLNNETEEEFVIVDTVDERDDNSYSAQGINPSDAASAEVDEASILSSLLDNIQTVTLAEIKEYNIGLQSLMKQFSDLSTSVQTHVRTCLKSQSEQEQVRNIDQMDKNSDKVDLALQLKISKEKLDKLHLDVSAKKCLELREDVA